MCTEGCDPELQGGKGTRGCIIDVLGCSFYDDADDVWFSLLSPVIYNTTIYSFCFLKIHTRHVYKTAPSQPMVLMTYQRSPAVQSLKDHLVTELHGKL